MLYFNTNVGATLNSAPQPRGPEENTTVPSRGYSPSSSSALLILSTILNPGIHRSRHEIPVGVRFAGRNKLIHLIEAGEVVQRLGRGFTDGNQLAALTLHGLYSPMCLRPGPQRERPRPLMYGLSSMNYRVVDSS